MADKFAIVTGGSTGIGLELAKLAAKDGYDLLIAADTDLSDASTELQQLGATVRVVQGDLASFEGVDTLIEAAGTRQVDLLCANAGHGLGHGFLDQKPDEWRHVIDTNVTGTLYLLQRVLTPMVARNGGKVLVTGSIAGFIPGSFNAVYNATKAFVDNFTDALRNEIKDAEGVTVTTLMPGPVETEFFHRAGLDDTKVGSSDSKSDPSDVAKDGYDAVMAGKASIVSGWKNKIQQAAANVVPASVLAQQHRDMAEPGTDRG